MNKRIFYQVIVRICVFDVLLKGNCLVALSLPPFPLYLNICSTSSPLPSHLVTIVVNFGLDNDLILFLLSGVLPNFTSPSYFFFMILPAPPSFSPEIHLLANFCKLVLCAVSQGMSHVCYSNPISWSISRISEKNIGVR